MIGAWIFLRLLAVVYLVAFASLYGQIDGLIGSDGISPYSAFLDYLRSTESASGLASGWGRFWIAPSLLWMLPDHPLVLRGLTIFGGCAAISLLFGRFERSSLALLWCSYLSIVSVDYTFMQFQWDHLLLEAGLLSIFLPMREQGRFQIYGLPLLLLQFLVFRLMFGSGLVKILSGDPEWHNLSALRYHYLTQPLPSLPAYYLHKLPLWFHTACTVAMFAIELVLPFFFFGPRTLKQLAALATIMLQAAIFCSGNYTFFNILTVALTLTLLDDKFFVTRLPTIDGLVRRCIVPAEGPPRVSSPWATSVLATLFLLAAIQIVGLAVGFHALPRPFAALLESAAPIRAVNSYGLFAIMTTERLEIIVETSDDFKHWQPQRFRFKPQDVTQPPTQVAPYHPRLDWQMWFASLGSLRENPWFVRFMEHLLKQTPAVTALLREPPRAGPPPKFIRALSYRYRFSSLSEREIEPSWWKRELVGVYCPPLRLNERGSAVPVTTDDLNRLNAPEAHTS